MNLACRVITLLKFSQRKNCSHASFAIARVRNYCKVREFSGYVGQNSARSSTHETFHSKVLEKWRDTSIYDELSKAFQRLKYIRLLKTAVREGGPHPELNLKLANVITAARMFDPGFPVDSCILSSVDSKMVNGISEISASKGVNVVVEYESTNPTHIWHLIQTVCNKYEMQFLGSTSKQLLLFYELKGIFTSVETKAGRVINCEEAQAIAEKLGVGDPLVIAKDGILSVELHCHPSDLHRVKAILEQELVFEEVFSGYVPKHFVALPNLMKEKIGNAVIEISCLPGIQRIYENVE